jgi:kynurenine formamidase
LSGKDFLFLCLPLKMRDGTGCPVRATALVM